MMYFAHIQITIDPDSTYMYLFSPTRIHVWLRGCRREQGKQWNVKEELQRIALKRGVEMQTIMDTAIKVSVLRANSATRKMLLSVAGCNTWARAPACKTASCHSKCAHRMSS